MSELIYNSNKAMVSFLLKRGCKVMDVKLGENDSLLFGFSKKESTPYAKEWFDSHDVDIKCKSKNNLQGGTGNDIKHTIPRTS